MTRRISIPASITSGLCLFLAFSHQASFLAWIALVPLFLVIDDRPSRLLAGFLAGAALSVCAFAWMIPGAHSFSGASIGYGIVIFLLCVTVFSSICAALLWLTPPLLLAPVWVLAENLLQRAAAGMPWFLFHIGNSLADNLYAIQPVSVIGVTGAGFIVVMVNYLVAWSIKRRNFKNAWIPLLLFGAYMLWGWCLLPPAAVNQTPSFPLANLRENIPPEVPWDETNGNIRVRQLLDQEDTCVAAHPEMILWAESAIPWTWSPHDDLVHEVLRHSGPQPITQIIGMNTAVSDGVVQNSAYCLLPGGKIAGRYDKVDPLLFIEKPAMGWQIPFFSSGGFSVKAGDNEEPLATPQGKVGVLICNESTLPFAAASRVRQGARFLLNMSNDGWFRNTWLVDQHFYNVRLRAVETRKDIAVNSNYGWSGCIDASGRVDTTGILFSIHPNDRQPVAVRYPLLPVYASLLFLLSLLVINQKTKIL